MPKPSNVEIEKPGKTTVNVPNDTPGERGRGGQTHMVINDLGSPQSIILKTSGDIYLLANEKMKLNSNECVHNSMISLTEYHERVERSVNTTETVKIGGDNTITVNGNQTVNVVTNHALNVGGTQDIYVDGNRAVVVGAGEQSVNIAQKMTTHVGGDYLLHVQGKSDTKFHGDCKWFKMGIFDEVNVSMAKTLKISESCGINIGAKQEANIGLSETVNVSGVMEQTFARKHSFSYGTETKFVVGPAKDADMSIKEFNTKALMKMKSALTKVATEIITTQSKLAKYGGTSIFG